MQPTPEQAFKIGFLTRCAEEGLTIKEAHIRVKEAIKQAKEKGLTKQALLPGLAGLGALAGGLGYGGAKLLGAVTPAALTTAAVLGIGTPVLAGALGGYGAAKTLGSQDSNMLENAKRDEIIAEYERLADEAKKRTKVKTLQNLTGRRVIPLTPSLG